MTIALEELSEEEVEYVNKALGQFRLQLNGVFTPFKMYGLHLFIPLAIDAIVELAWAMHIRLNGIDVPIVSDMVPLPDD